MRTPFLDALFSVSPAPWSPLGPGFCPTDVQSLTKCRCEDAHEDIVDERTKGYKPLCTIVKKWNKVLSPDWSCGPECEEAKRMMCYSNIRMCPSLRCGDIDNTAGTVPWSVARACAQQLSISEALYTFSAESSSSEAAPAAAFLRPLSDEDRDAAEPLRKHFQRGKECGAVCKKKWKDLCWRNPVLCMQLR